MKSQHLSVLFLSLFFLHLDNDDGFLDDIVDLGLNQFEQGRDTPLSGRFDLDCQTTNGAHCLADKIHINFCGISKKYNR